MTLLSRKADYALLILSYLYDRPGTARAVAEKFGLSRPFVANILKELCHHGFVASHRGVKGGYDLARPANTITLAELMETLEDGVRLAVCNPGTHDQDVCSIAGVCTLKGPISAGPQPADRGPSGNHAGRALRGPRRADPARGTARTDSHGLVRFERRETIARVSLPRLGNSDTRSLSR